MTEFEIKEDRMPFDYKREYKGSYLPPFTLGIIDAPKKMKTTR